MLWTERSSLTRLESLSVSSACPADFSMLYLSISCSLASIGSDLGILEEERRGGREGEVGKGESGVRLGWGKFTGDSSDLRGEVESVARGLRVPASLGGLEPPEPPLTTELAVEEGGRSGDCGLSWAGEWQAGRLFSGLLSSWMLAGRLWRHLAVRFSRLAGSGLGKRPDLRGNPGWAGRPGRLWRALARSRNNISRLELELGGEAWLRPGKNMLGTLGDSDLELTGFTLLTEFLK